MDQLIQHSDEYKEFAPDDWQTYLARELMGGVITLPSEPSATDGAFFGLDIYSFQQGEDWQGDHLKKDCVDPGCFLAARWVNFHFVRPKRITDNVSFEESTGFPRASLARTDRRLRFWKDPI